MSEDAGIEPRAVATTALTVRRSIYHLDKSPAEFRSLQDFPSAVYFLSTMSVLTIEIDTLE
jgi:hypothetical protein